MMWMMLAFAGEPADRVVRGELWDGDGGRAGAVVIRDGRIVAVVADPRDHIGPDTVVTEAPFITAGFVDAHAHPDGLGSRLGELELGQSSLASTLQTVAAAPGSGWILGRGWDQNLWTDTPGAWPTATQLDAVTGARPAALRRVDEHALWLNHAALKAAGITADTPDPPGGEILRGPDGEPSGVLVDEAMAAVPIPPPTPAERQAQVRAVALEARRAGLTGMHAMYVSDEALAAFRALDARGELPIRLWVYVAIDSEAAKQLMATGRSGSGRVKIMGVKAFADGALGSRGAWLSADYSDRPGHRGKPIHDGAQLEALATGLLAQDAQLAVHAIGDRAVHTTLDAFASARAKHPESTARLRVEHAQIVAPADQSRFASLGAIASMQPTHATSDSAWVSDRLGAERVPWSYAWRDLERAGARVVFGSDYPIEPLGPALGLHAAITRTHATGEPVGGWRPEQRFTRAEAIRAFTERAAYAVHEEANVGSLSAGQVADLSLWTADWQPLGSIVDGRDD